MHRASSYNIYVSLPNVDDEMLLVHGYTGAYDKVSREVAQYVRSLEAGPAPKPLYGDWTDIVDAGSATGFVEAPSDATIDILRKRGYLTTMTVDEEVGYLARITKSVHNRPTKPQYIVMPTYNCNLRCSYCFQDHMRTDSGFKHLLRTMPTSMADRIIGAMTEIEVDHGFPREQPPKRSVLFFGGEPLLAANKPVIRHFIDRLTARGPTTFSAVTNATELGEYRDLLGPSGLSWLQITLDGPPEEHDKRRIYADGSGSFDRIAGNVELALELGVAVSIRLNVDRENIALLPALADVMVARGWNRSPLLSVYTAPIHNTTPSVAELRASHFDSWDLDQAIDGLRAEHPNAAMIRRPDDQMLGRARKLFEDHTPDLPELRSSFCGAHQGMYIFDSFGDIYACWEKTGDPSIRIGRILEDSTVEYQEGMRKLWRSRTPVTNPTCRQCRYALHCGGGCAVLAERKNGKFHSNYCDSFADRFRSAVAEAYTGYVNGVAMIADERVCDL